MLIELFDLGTSEPSSTSSVGCIRVCVESGNVLECEKEFFGDTSTVVLMVLGLHPSRFLGRDGF